MNSFTLIDCCSLSGVGSPTICVLTGPWEGSSSLYAKDWNWVTASAKTGWVAPEAPLNGSELSSYLNPNRSKPFVYECSQSFLEFL